jgi:hypothetical protein
MEFKGLDLRWSWMWLRPLSHTLRFDPLRVKGSCLSFGGVGADRGGENPYYVDLDYRVRLELCQLLTVS